MGARNAVKSASPQLSTLAISLLIFACVLGTIGLEFAYTNITRVDYDIALNKWRSQGAEEYEMVVDNLAMTNSGIWTLRVHGDKVDLVLDNGVPVGPRPAVTGEHYRPYTVEGLFSDIDRMLAENGPFSLEDGCMITFDRALGYPTSIECNAKPWNGTTDLHSRTTVESLKILKRKTPTRNR